MREFLGDNPILNVNGIGLERLKAVFDLCEAVNAKGYAVQTDKNRIAFFKYPDAKDMVAFPVALPMSTCAEITFNWLQAATYPREPDHDGDNEKGWRCYTGDWGQIDGLSHGAFLAVEPFWIMFGK
jgi:hypothetical protein